VTALWKGRLRVGFLEIPIALHPGEEPEPVDFTLLDRRDLAPLGHRRVNKNTGEEVPAEHVVRGFEVEPGRLVTLTDEEIERLAAERSHRVEVLSFVSPAEISPVFYERPYYLEPEAGGEKGYALLREALIRTGRAGIARVLLRTRQHLAVLLPQDRLLLLNLLRYPSRLRAPADLRLPGRDLDALGVAPLEIALAEQLIETMAEPWVPAVHRDEFHEELVRYMRHKLLWKEPPAGPAAPAASVPSATPADLPDVLRRSLERARQERALRRPA
jgi:DNA end-binding protein Ku